MEFEFNNAETMPEQRRHPSLHQWTSLRGDKNTFDRIFADISFFSLPFSSQQCFLLYKVSTTKHHTILQRSQERHGCRSSSQATQIESAVNLVLASKFSRRS